MIEVIATGQCTTVQDYGRFGHVASGVAHSGALTPFSHALANHLVGNAPRTALLEIYGVGPALCFAKPVCIALYGVHAAAYTQSRRVIAVNRPVWIEAGEVMQVGPPVHGMTSYLSVAGGIDVPLVLGSRSTDTANRLGGVEGRPIRKGDVLSIPGDNPTQCRSIDCLRWHKTSVQPLRFPTAESPQLVHFIPGRGTTLLSKLYQTFLDTTFTVGPNSNRIAMRFDEQLPTTGQSMSTQLSEGTTYGTIQLLPAGDPLVLMADGPTSGGYPVMGEVISAHREALAQLRPGGQVRFIPVSVTQAEQCLKRQFREYQMRVYAIQRLRKA